MIIDKKVQKMLEEAKTARISPFMNANAVLPHHTRSSLFHFVGYLADLSLPELERRALSTLEEIKQETKLPAILGTSIERKPAGPAMVLEGLTLVGETRSIEIADHDILPSCTPVGRM